MPAYDVANINKAFINSMDHKGNFDEIELIVDKDVSVRALITTKMFDDGVPCVKYFERDNIEADFTFEKDKKYMVVGHSYFGPTKTIYWFSNGIWYEHGYGDDGWEDLNLE